MTEDVLNNTTNEVFIPTIIAQKALQRFPAYLNLARTVSKDSDWVTASMGATIQVPKTGAVSANDKTAGNVFTKQNPTGTNVSVTLNKHKEVTFTIDDVTKMLENQDTQAKYAEDGAIALAEAVETSLAQLHPNITNTISWDRTSATTIDASLLAVRKFFTDQKVPKTEQKYLYVDATVFNDLLGVQKYTDQSWRGQNNTVAEGQMIKTYGFEIWESQMIETSGSPVSYHNFAYTRGGLVLASRPLPAPRGFGGNYAVINDPSIGLSLRTLFWYNADLGAHQLTIDLLYGVNVLDVRRVVEVESV
ncbi:MAG: P22 phage major capsid protein family protein [Candidatus Paceibacterota bacterium]|jgi:hypothetical protein